MCIIIITINYIIHVTISPRKKKPSVLFILKSRTTYWGENAYSHKASGLYNSANYINHILKENGFESKLVEVVDNNCIDREVTNFDADIVVIEAIWVTPEKMTELTGLFRHRHRKWIIRNHSELPFLALEGISLQWLLAYPKIKNVFVSNNSPIANKEIEELCKLHCHPYKDNILLLTNFYPIDIHKHHIKKLEHDYINISCFGAIRPLKNHIEQAIAAILYAKRIGKKLNFHINATRIENKADPILKSLRGLFANLHDYKLIEHSWLNKEEFLELCKKMNIGLQVSFSETFNIVAADHVAQGVPCITSDEVPWMPENYCAIPTNSLDIADKIGEAIEHGVKHQAKALHEYSEESEKLWVKTLENLYQLK